MEIGLKSCYLATLPDGKFSVHVWIFCPIPQDLWLACCTAGEKKKVWTKVKSLCEHSKCPTVNVLSSDFTSRKPALLAYSIAISSCSPNTPNPLKKELYIPQLLHACHICPKCVYEVTYIGFTSHQDTQYFFFSVAFRFASMQLTVIFNLKIQPSSSLM